MPYGRLVCTGNDVGPIDAHLPDDAAFIVRACNAHEGLVEAAEKVRAWLEAVIASGQYPIGAPTAVSHLSAALAAAEAK